MINNNLSIGNLNHEQAKKSFGKISKECDKDIYLGVLYIKDNISKLHSLKGPRSIEKLIRSHLDVPVRKWMENNGLLNFILSKTVIEEYSQTARHFQNLVENYIEIHGGRVLLNIMKLLQLVML